MYKPLVILCLVLATTLARAEDHPSRPGHPEPSRAEMWGALGSGVFFGFGTGHMIENRWRQAGWPFTVGDGVGLGLLAATLGDCVSCKDQSTRDTLRIVGASVFITSRLVQIAELVAFGIQHGQFSPQYEPPKDTSLSFVILPVPQDTGVIAASSLRF